MDNKMKILVVYYSRTGNTKYVAEKIAGILKARKDEIIDLKDRKGKITGFINSMSDSFQRGLTEIEFNEDPNKYDLVIIGTPVWSGGITPSIRTYLTKNGIKKVAFFYTHGRNPANVYKDFENLSARPIATLGLKGINVKSRESQERIKEFCNQIRNEVEI